MKEAHEMQNVIRIEGDLLNLRLKAEYDHRKSEANYGDTDSMRKKSMAAWNECLKFAKESATKTDSMKAMAKLEYQNENT